MMMMRPNNGQRPFIGVMLALALFVMSACQSARPEAKLARHLEAINTIMVEHKDDPAAGVDALRSYLHSDLPDMMEESAEVLLMLQEVDNDQERIKRAKRLHKVLSGPMRDFINHEAAFKRALRKDPEARKKLAEVMDPLHRILPSKEALASAPH